MKRDNKSANSILQQKRARREALAKGLRQNRLWSYPHFLLTLLNDEFEALSWRQLWGGEAELVEEKLRELRRLRRSKRVRLNKVINVYLAFQFFGERAKTGDRDDFGILLFFAFQALREIEAVLKTNAQLAQFYAPYFLVWPTRMPLDVDLMKERIAYLKKIGLGGALHLGPRFGMKLKNPRAAIAYSLLAYIRFVRSSPRCPEDEFSNQCHDLETLDESTRAKWWSVGLTLLQQVIPDARAFDSLQAKPEEDTMTNTSDNKTPPAFTEVEIFQKFIDRVREFFHDFAPHFEAIPETNGWEAPKNPCKSPP